MLRAALHNEPCGTERELGPYYAHVGRAAATVFVNSSSVHDGEVLAFGSQADRQGETTWAAWAAGPGSGQSRLLVTLSRW